MWSTLVRVWPSLSNTCPNLVDVMPNTAELGTLFADLGRIWQASADSVNIDQLWPGLDKVGRIPSKVGRVRSNFGQSRPMWGWVCPTLEQSRLMSADDVVQTLAGRRRNRTTIGQCVAMCSRSWLQIGQLADFETHRINAQQGSPRRALFR